MSLTRDEARRIAEHVAGPRVTKQPDWQGLPPLIIAEEYLKRALPYRDQAIELPDTVNSRPNWPKHFLIVSGASTLLPGSKTYPLETTQETNSTADARGPRLLAAHSTDAV